MEALHNLGINPLILAGQIVNFLILFFVFKKFLYKPLLGMLEKRKTTIENSLKKAEAIEKEYTETERINKEKIANTAKEAQEIINKAKEGAEKSKKEIVLSAQQEAEGIMEKTKQEIESEKNKILAEVRKETADLATAVSASILQKNMDQELQKKLIDEAINNLDQYYQKR